MQCDICHKQLGVANIVQCWCEQLLCIWCAEDHVENCSLIPTPWKVRVEARIRVLTSSFLPTDCESESVQTESTQGDALEQKGLTM